MDSNLIKISKGKEVLVIISKYSEEGGIRFENIWNCLPGGSSGLTTLWVKNVGDNVKGAIWRECRISCRDIMESPQEVRIRNMGMIALGINDEIFRDTEYYNLR